MKTLYALIIGIDKYPIPAHQLQGCVNDAMAFTNYLVNFCKSNGINFVKKQLFDDAAKRLDVVNAFSHFDAATQNDICVLYYSGHGSQMPAAPEFWDASDGKSETIVCYDSRLTDGRDMIDKELGYLIWSATKNKNVHFLAVMDCCHSGSNTRDLNVRARMAEPSTYTPKSVSEFVGFQSYINFQPPGARYIHLAAAKDEETAKEMSINNISRGAFTYSLIETLQDTGGLINYADLIQRVRLKVRNRAVEQTPQMNPYGAISDVILSFLGELRQQGNFIANYDNQDGWIANIGSIQGVSPQTVFSVENISGDLPVAQLLPNFSKLNGLANADTSKQFNAKIKNWGQGSINLKKRTVAFSEDSETLGVQMFNQAITQNQPTNFVIVPDIKFADYIIRAWDNTYRLTTIDSTVPLFRRVQGYSIPAATEFIEDIKTAANWRNRLELNNTTSSISENAISITFFDVQQHESNNRVFTQPDKDNDVVMQMCVTNRDTRPLWISCVYFSDDFSITNQFMPKKFLNPGETAWLEYLNKKDIPLYIQPEFLSWGVNTLKEYFKIFVSTDELDTYIHNQDALPLDLRAAGSTKRAIGRPMSTTIPLADWRCFDIDFTTVCPMPKTNITGSRNIDAINVPVETPPGFFATFTPTASVYLQDSKSTGDSNVPPKFPYNFKITDAGITEGLNNAPKLDVLILENIVGTISKLQPLKITCAFYKDKALIVPYGYDAVGNIFSPIGNPSANGVIVVEKLFPAKDIGNKSFIFFKKMSV